jgi:hypothetical protein
MVSRRPAKADRLDPVSGLPQQNRVTSAEDFLGHLVFLDVKEKLAIVALLANDDPVHLAIEGEANELGITAGPRSCTGWARSRLEKDAADKLR